jgi:biopolymer transport protein ExbD
MDMARLGYLEQGFRPWLSAPRRKAKRQSSYYCCPDVSALLAVFLVIFVSLATTPENVCSRGAVVDLFTSAHSRLTRHANREDALRIVVTRDGRLFLGNHEVVPEELPGQLRDGVQAGAENRVYLLVDSRSKYADVKPVLNEIGLAGVKNVSLLTRPVPRQNADSQKVAPDHLQPEGISR